MQRPRKLQGYVHLERSQTTSSKAMSRHASSNARPTLFKTNAVRVRQNTLPGYKHGVDLLLRPGPPRARVRAALGFLVVWASFGYGVWAILAICPGPRTGIVSGAMRECSGDRPCIIQCGVRPCVEKSTHDARLFWEASGWPLGTDSIQGWPLRITKHWGAHLISVSQTLRPL